MRKFTVLFLLALSTCSMHPAFAADLRDSPDQARTPGVINPAVTQENIGRTICKKGWTATIRPPASYTNRLKLMQIVEYQYPNDTQASDVEEDHRVPLEVGGHPRDPRNLWPEPWVGERGARLKDRLENAIKRDVCSKRLTLKQGQAVFLGNWWPVYDERFGSSPRRAASAKRR